MNRKVRERSGEEIAEKQSDYLYWWLLLALFFEYARPGSYFPPLQILPLNSVIPLSLLVVTLFAKGLRPWNEIFRDRMAIWPAIFVLFIAVSLTWADVQTYAYNRFMLTLGYLFLIIMIARIVTTERRLRGVFFILIAAHLFLLAMNPKVITEPTVRHYIAGATFLGDGNDYGLSLCILFPFAIELALHSKTKFMRGLSWGLSLLLLIAIVGTQSRGASLGVATVFSYLWLQSTRKAATMAGIAFVALVVLLFAPDIYFERMSTATDSSESSANSRIQAWMAGARMAADNVLGVGAGNFPNNFPKYRGPDAPVRWMTAHSMYFLVLGELGILGLLLLLKMLIGNVRQNTRLRRALLNPRDGLADESTVRDAGILYRLNASVIGFAMAGAFLSVAYYPHIFVLTGLLISARAIIAARGGIDLAALQSKPGRARKVRGGRGGAEPSALRVREPPP